MGEILIVSAALTTQAPRDLGYSETPAQNPYARAGDLQLLR